jgi:uncharacterized protein YbjT (DUF2867 family)
MALEVVIAGATGLVGRACLRHLLDRYDSVTALVRRPLKVEMPKLIERQIDFDRIGTIEIPPGAHVYCALGTTIKVAGSEDAFRRVDFEYPRMLAERAAAAGGARFMLVSSVGAAEGSSNFYLRVKGELEESVRAMRLEEAHIFRPSFLIGERTEKRPGEAIGIAIARGIGFLMVGPLRKYHPIRAATVAEAMVVAANKNESAHGDPHGDKAAHQDKAACFVYHYREMVRLAGGD